VLTKINEYVEKFDLIDKNFIGTIAFRSEEVCLPDGSRMALGIDDGHWVLVYQKEAKSTFQLFEFDLHGKKIFVDKKSGGLEDIKYFKKLVRYFLNQALVEDLVTILSAQAKI